MVGWAEQGQGLLSPILSCTWKICAMYEMHWQRSMSFNSFCTPSVSTRASCVCASSPDSDSRDQNSRRTNRDTDHHQNTRATTARAPTATSQEARREEAPGALRAVSIKRGEGYSALVSQSCCTAMLLHAISHRRAKREPTRSPDGFVARLKGNAQSSRKLCYLSSFVAPPPAHADKTSPR